MNGVAHLDGEFVGLRLYDELYNQSEDNTENEM